MRRWPRCEACRAEAAFSLSFHPRTGWIVAGSCTAETERYWLFLHDRGRGVLDSAPARAQWVKHLSAKRWFDAEDFTRTLARLDVAPTWRWAKGRRRARLRENRKVSPKERALPFIPAVVL